MGSARVSNSLAGPIPADPSAGDRVLPADTWPVRWARHDGLELGALEAAVPCTRARTREVLREWGLAPLAEDAEAIIAELAASSREQLSGIEQVNRAVTQLDQMTQQNAALVEQASAASNSMAGRSHAMSEMLDRYRLSLGEGQRSEAPAQVRRVA